ncbi:hypothetical protein AGMMS50239_38900 [Bacteroidia bacterium]|nr:hypothetical protein AGMMS50239_38900 [Bacteroidia bacterium]
MPLLEENGLLVVQPIIDDNLTTYVIDIDSGETLLRSNFKLTNQTDPQKRLAECSYYRRGALQSIFSLNIIDDDGESLANRKEGKPTFKAEPGKPILEDFSKIEAALQGGFVMDLNTVRAKYSVRPEDLPKLEALIKKYS